MRTEDLIASLSADLKPLARHAVAGRLALGVGMGGALALALLLFWLGLRPDIAPAAASSMFWMKLAFTFSVALAALVVVERLARPGAGIGRFWWCVAAPVLIVAMMGAAQLSMAPAGARAAMWLGHSAAQCPVRIVALAAPVYVGLVWAFRRLAPTRLRLAGFGAGIMAGAVGASVYALYCTENAAAFLATWYTLGILASGAIGALLGPRLLRW